MTWSPQGDDGDARRAVGHLGVAHVVLDGQRAALPGRRPRQEEPQVSRRRRQGQCGGGRRSVDVQILALCLNFSTPSNVQKRPDVEHDFQHVGNLTRSADACIPNYSDSQQEETSSCCFSESSRLR